MRRSLQVRIAFMSAFALIATQGCGDSTYQHCVDENGVVVDDRSCQPADGGPARSGSTHPSYYRWWYGGHTDVGSRVSGGSYTAPAHGSGSVSRASSVSRGVFGTPGGHGSGGGHGHGGGS